MTKQTTGLRGLGVWAGLLGLSVSATSSACGSLGARASGGGCPEGEVCSASTPSGLRFYGTPLAGTLSNGVAAVLVGGRASLRWEDARFGPDPLVQHTMSSTRPDVIAVTGAVQGSADLSARSAGSAQLRVEDAEGLLLDRVSVSARALERAEVVGPWSLFFGLSSIPHPVAFGPGEQNVGVALFGAGDVRVVDEGLRFEAATPLSRVSWDTVHVNIGEVDVSLVGIASSGQRIDVVVPAAGPIDDVELLDLLLPRDGDDRISVGAGDSVCVVPLSRGYEVILVGPLDLRFTVDGVSVPVVDGSPCAALPDLSAATTAVEVQAGGFSRTFTFDVDPARARRPASAALTVSHGVDFPTWQPRTLGDRAARVRSFDLGGR